MCTLQGKCRLPTLSMKRHFETKREKLFRGGSKKEGAFRKEVFRYEKKSSQCKSKYGKYSSYKVVECIA